jgi:hypothetical protein
MIVQLGLDDLLRAKCLDYLDTLGKERIRLDMLYFA